jgi:hypothetical protein
MEGAAGRPVTGGDTTLRRLHFVAPFVVYASSHTLSVLPVRRIEHGPASPSMINPPTNLEAPHRFPVPEIGPDICPRSAYPIYAVPHVLRDQIPRGWF